MVRPPAGGGSSVGGGTGMISFQFKAGIGTASRRVGEYMLGVLVQTNFGLRKSLVIAGAPVGQEITDLDAGISLSRPSPAADRSSLWWQPMPHSLPTS